MCFKLGLSRSFVENKKVLLVVSLAKGLWATATLLGFLKEILRVDNAGSRVSQLWNVSSVLSGTIARKVSLMLGQADPFAAKLMSLKESCREQYREWKVRIAKREYYRALRRKKITHKECVLLLKAFAEWNPTTQCEEGVLPGD